MVRVSAFSGYRTSSDNDHDLLIRFRGRIDPCLPTTDTQFDEVFREPVGRTFLPLVAKKNEKVPIGVSGDLLVGLERFPVGLNRGFPKANR